MAATERALGISHEAMIAEVRAQIAQIREGSARMAKRQRDAERPYCRDCGAWVIVNGADDCRAAGHHVCFPCPSCGCDMPDDTGCMECGASSALPEADAFSAGRIPRHALICQDIHPW